MALCTAIKKIFFLQLPFNLDHFFVCGNLLSDFHHPQLSFMILYYPLNCRSQFPDFSSPLPMFTYSCIPKKMMRLYLQVYRFTTDNALRYIYTNAYKIGLIWLAHVQCIILIINTRI